MRKYDFYQLDVFTNNRFCGNPLAVFPHATGISDKEMQSIANEMNLSETVFVLPSNIALKKLRIFTPKQELPLAGHPVVGTWNLLANLTLTPQSANGSVEIEQEVKLGVLPVEIKFKSGKPDLVVMTQDTFKVGRSMISENETVKFAEGLGLRREDLAESENLPIQTVSTGINALVVPVKNLNTLSRCRINSSLLSECYLNYGAIGVYAFTFDTFDDDSKVHARFFAPDDGIPEDPATGSAAGSLSGYLIHHGALDTNKFIIEQGDFMNRPSRIYSEVTGNIGNVEKVQISGSSIIVGKGEIYLD